MGEIRLAPTFEMTVHRAGLSMRELARASDVGHQTLYGLVRPHRTSKRTGRVRPQTAWKVARGFAGLTGTSVDDAYRLLFVEIGEPMTTLEPQEA